MPYLAFDTETTGLPLKGVNIEDPRQPRIVQIAAQLIDDDGVILGDLNAIIKPDGWSSIPEGAAKAHGISFERCMEEGRDMKEVLTEFNLLKDRATDRFAYNISFDKRLLLREAKYHKIEHDSSKFDASSYCVMRMVTPIVGMAPTAKMVKAGFAENKPPKLIEAYQFFFGRPFERAHDAMNDVNATRAIFFHVKNNHSGFFRPEEKREYNPAPEERKDPAAAEDPNSAF